MEIRFFEGNNAKKCRSLCPRNTTLVVIIGFKELLKEFFGSEFPSGLTVSLHYGVDVEGFLDTLTACVICSTSPTGLFRGSSAKYYRLPGIRVRLRRFLQLSRSLKQKKSDREESSSWEPIRSKDSDIERF